MISFNNFKNYFINSKKDIKLENNDLAKKNHNLNNHNLDNRNLKNHSSSNNSEEPSRLLKYDNLRGLAIFLVVIGHVMAPFTDFFFFSSIGKVIFTIHMPLLFFISGYFSKIKENNGTNAFKSVFIPYILFVTLWILFAMIILGSGFPKFPYVIPARGLWYLLSLFCMRLFLPIFVKIKHVFWIMIICALLIGCISVDENYLSFLKTMYYLPFFMLGYYFKNSNHYFSLNIYPKIKKLGNDIKNFILNHKYLIFALLIAFLMCIFVIFSDFPKGFFSFELSYVQMKLSRKIGLIMRLGVMASSILIIIILNYLMTNKHTIFTKIGVNSLAIYVLHFYFTRILDIYFIRSELGSSLHNNIFLASIYVIVTTVLILFILSRDFISKYINIAIKFIDKLILK